MGIRSRTVTWELLKHRISGLTSHLLNQNPHLNQKYWFQHQTPTSRPRSGREATALLPSLPIQPTPLWKTASGKRCRVNLLGVPPWGEHSNRRQQSVTESSKGPIPVFSCVQSTSLHYDLYQRARPSSLRPLLLPHPFSHAVFSFPFLYFQG